MRTRLLFPVFSGLLTYLSADCRGAIFTLLLNNLLLDLAKAKKSVVKLGHRRNRLHLGAGIELPLFKSYLEKNHYVSFNAFISARSAITSKRSFISSISIVSMRS